MPREHRRGAEPILAALFTADSMFCKILAMIPALLSAPIFIMMERKKAFTVFRLIPIRSAICRVLNSCTKWSTVSTSL